MNVPGQSRQRELIMHLEREAGDPDEPVPTAATVALLRGVGEAREVLMLERPDRGSFAGAWVFPGGRLDPEDGDVSTPAAEAAAALVAGVRETDEETGLVLDPASLVATALWHPPLQVPLRVRTWFFRAPAPEGDLVLSEAEVVHAEWARPADVLDRHARGELTLYPPTWVTLYQLATEQPAPAVPAVFRTHIRRREGGLVFFWEDDVEYDADVADAVGPLHRLDTRTLPWRYERR